MPFVNQRAFSPKAAVPSLLSARYLASSGICKLNRQAFSITCSLREALISFELANHLWQFAKLQGRKAIMFQLPWLHEEQLRAKCSRLGGREYEISVLQVLLQERLNSHNGPFYIECTTGRDHGGMKQSDKLQLFFHPKNYKMEASENFNHSLLTVTSVRIPGTGRFFFLFLYLSNLSFKMRSTYSSIQM